MILKKSIAAGHVNHIPENYSDMKWLEARDLQIKLPRFTYSER
jgi:hypothetical protein